MSKFQPGDKVRANRDVLALGIGEGEVHEIEAYDPTVPTYFTLVGAERAAEDVAEGCTDRFMAFDDQFDLAEPVEAEAHPDPQDFALALADHIKMIANNFDAASRGIQAMHPSAGSVLAEETARFFDGEQIFASSNISWHEAQARSLVRQAVVHLAVAEAAKIPF